MGRGIDSDGGGEELFFFLIAGLEARVTGGGDEELFFFLIAGLEARD
jgi:hypothetical protein